MLCLIYSTTSWCKTLMSVIAKTGQSDAFGPIEVLCICHPKVKTSGTCI